MNITQLVTNRRKLDTQIKKINDLSISYNKLELELNNLRTLINHDKSKAVKNY